MFEYLNFGLTRDMNHIPSLCRLMDGNLAENDAKITKGFQSYLVGDGGVTQAKLETSSSTDKRRSVPWKKELTGIVRGAFD
jgi:hypothetical protein